MSRQTAASDDFWPLLNSACDDGLADRETQELATLLEADSIIRKEFVRHIQLRTDVQLLFRARKASDGGLARVRATLLETPPSDTPASGILPATFHSSAGYFASGWPVAYLVATVIFAIGLIVGTLVHVSTPTQVVQPSSSLPSLPAPRPSIVGRITGMVDCEWSEPDTEAINGAHVPLGRRYALSSGLMEITYDTGAKVLLQGPVTYEVMSPAGGYLSQGKLTARLEEKSEIGGQRPESANQKSEIRNHTFAVRTPTAVVTDLGTEFGVEVDKKGHTTSHVFRGTVSMNAIDGGKITENHATILHANESARTEPATDGTQRTVVRRAAVEPRVFVRQLKSKSPVNVSAWFRMGEDEPNARAGEPVGREIHSHNKRPVRLERHGSPTYSADTEAPGSVLSVTFHGRNDGECFSRPRFAFVPNDYFILETWVKLHKLGPEKQVIVISGQGHQNGYCLTVENGRWIGVFGGVGWIDSGVACDIDKWTHLALLCERGKAQLWIDGRPAGNVLDAIPNSPDGPFTIGGQIGYPERTFHGEIDEVRLSTFIAPFRPEMLLFSKADRAQ
jgi:hypothetical protein